MHDVGGAVPTWVLDALPAMIFVVAETHPITAIALSL
jgi:hypothetical protein